MEADGEEDEATTPDGTSEAVTSPPEPITIPILRSALWMVATSVVLLVAHVIVTLLASDVPAERTYSFKQFHRLFNVAGEGNIPTWWSQSLLLLAAGAVLVRAIIARSDRERDTRYWIALVPVFVYLSIDEGSAIHELAMDPVRDWLGIGSGFLAYAWVVPFGFATLVFAAIFVRFLIRLPSLGRLWIALGGIIYVVGALGFEMVGARYGPELSGRNHGLLMVVEEGLENAGIIAFLVGVGFCLQGATASRSRSFRVVR